MKWILVLALFATVWAQEKAELPLAEPCDAEACQLPDCRCSSTDIPGELNARDVPQFVLVTFDGSVSIINVPTYRKDLYNRLNSNSCPAGTTFFINHGSDYETVNEIYNRGYEIALRSISRQTQQSYWAEADYDDMKKEFGDQRIQMSHFASIPYDEIKGIRIPFLHMTGNASFQVMADYGLQYDSTWTTIKQLWPYTLDYASTQECTVPPCPSASIPGVWELPMVSWLDLNGEACAMVDSCLAVPSLTDEDAWFNFIVANFERHYFGNRSPFGFYVHESFVAERNNPAVNRAFVRFLDMINNMNDVFMVNGADVIEWVKNPVPVDEYREQPCKTITQSTCPATICGPLPSEQDETHWYWISICNVCPNYYPWLGNPLGQ